MGGWVANPTVFCRRRGHSLQGHTERQTALCPPTHSSSQFTAPSLAQVSGVCLRVVVFFSDCGRKTFLERSHTHARGTCKPPQTSSRMYESHPISMKIKFPGPIRRPTGLRGSRRHVHSLAYTAQSFLMYGTYVCMYL